MTHRLDPLLRPKSVAIVGASGRADSLGEWSLANLLKGNYTGAIYPVNPNYEHLQGIPCFPSLLELPESPEMVMFAVGDKVIERALNDAIAAGVSAAVIQSPLVLDDDAVPNLKLRIQEKAAAAGLLVCGANGMGFYNVRDHVWACGFDSSDHAAPGNIALISHSGSGMSGLIDCDERLRINLAVSTGNEIGVTMDEYLDFVLDLPETKAVGLFIETARNPKGFRAALRKAVRRRTPIVALKVGRTEEAAQLSVSHSGAMAGNDAAYDALFDRYGVQRVRDMEELATTLILFAELPLPGEGGLVSLHDSGGERQLMVDLCEQANVPLTALNNETVAAIEEVIDPELPAVNPLDAWSRGGPAAVEQMTRCFTTMLRDPAAAIGAVVHDRAPYGKVYPSYLEYMRRAHAETDKPVVLVAARQGTGHDEAVVSNTRAGFPVLDNVSVFLNGVRTLFSYRDFLLRKDSGPVPVPAEGSSRWSSNPTSGKTLGEAESLEMFADFGLPVAKTCLVAQADELPAAAAQLGFPLALKTAEPDVLHKSDCGGVVLGIDSIAELQQHYSTMASSIGRQAIVSAMAGEGVEMMLGARQDPQFGPIVLIGFGGIHAETLKDVVFALPPFSVEHARRCIDSLQLRAMLNGRRGKPASDIDAFCEVAATFSSMIDSLRDSLAEVDANPVIVHQSGCTVVDALVVKNDATTANLSVTLGYGATKPAPA